MNHYFRVTETPKQKQRGFFSLWLSGFSITSCLIVANIIFYILLALLGAFSDAQCGKSFCKFVALQANNFFNHGYIWTLLTSMFSHILLFHLFVNMLSLFFIGKFLEMIIGRKRFFWMYIFSGIFAGLFYVVLSWFFGSGVLGSRIFGSPATYAVGASGAIFAIAGVLALLVPKNKVSFIAGPLIAVILQITLDSFISNNALANIINIILTIYIFVSIFSMLSFNPFMRRISLPIAMPFWALPLIAIMPLVLISFFVDLPIGNMAHLGGFIAGALYGLFLRLKYKKKTRMISEYFSEY